MWSFTEKSGYDDYQALMIITSPSLNILWPHFLMVVIIIIIVGVIIIIVVTISKSSDDL